MEIMITRRLSFFQMYFRFSFWNYLCFLISTGIHYSGLPHVHFSHSFALLVVDLGYDGASWVRYVGNFGGSCGTWHGEVKCRATPLKNWCS